MNKFYRHETTAAVSTKAAHLFNQGKLALIAICKLLLGLVQLPIDAPTTYKDFEEKSSTSTILSLFQDKRQGFWVKGSLTKGVFCLLLMTGMLLIGQNANAQATGYNTYDMIDGLTPAASPVLNPCFVGTQGIWQKRDRKSVV